MLTYDFADINIPIFVGLYVGYKVVKRTKVWKPLEMDFVTVRTPSHNSYIFLLIFFFLFRVYPHQKRPKHQKSHQLRSWKRLLHFCSSFPELYYPSSIPPCIIHTVVIGIYMLYNIHITLHTHVNALAFLIYTIRCLLHLHNVWLNSNSCEWGEMR